MTSRLFALLIGALVLMAPHAQAGQATASSKQQFRTPWGDPDLQGNWDGGTLTPMQRPARFANRPVHCLFNRTISVRGSGASTLLI